MSVLGVIYGSFALLCCSLSLFDVLLTGMVAAPSSDGFMGRVVGAQEAIIAGNPLVRALLAIYNLGALGLGAFLIASCVGCFMMKPWGRAGMLVFAVLSMLNSVFGNVVHAIYIQPAVTQELANLWSVTLPPGSLVLGIIAGVLCNVIFLSIYPIAILVVFNRKLVRAAFAAGGYLVPPPPQAPYPYATEPLHGFPPPEIAAPQYPGDYPPPQPPGGYAPPPGSYPPPPSDPSDYHRQ